MTVQTWCDMGQLCSSAPVSSTGQALRHAQESQAQGSHPHPGPLPSRGGVTLTPALSRRGRGGEPHPFDTLRRARLRTGSIFPPMGAEGDRPCPSAPLDSGFRRNDGCAKVSPVSSTGQALRQCSGRAQESLAGSHPAGCDRHTKGWKWLRRSPVRVDDSNRGVRAFAGIDVGVSPLFWSSEL